MSDLASVLLGDKERPVRLVYGVASGDNTVAVRGATTAVTLPAITPVKSGDYCAVLESGADRVIVGPVDAALKSYTPALTAETTDPTLGTGATTEGFYKVRDGVCDVWVRIVLGTSSSAGSGTYNVSLPVAVSDISVGSGFILGSVIGVGRVVDSSDPFGSTKTVDVGARTSTLVRLSYIAGASAYALVGAAAPFAWGDGDAITLHASYPI